MWTVARDRATGRLVAYSQLFHVPDSDRADQGDTLILREHRGHRHGLALKLTGLDRVAEVWPDAGSIQTANDETNAPMLAVNRAMGFEPTTREICWTRPVGD